MKRMFRTVLACTLLTAGLVSVGTSSASAATLQTGVVTTGDGTPLAGATVAVFDETGKGIAGSTTTDANGMYSLDDCPSCVGQVVAAAEGYYSARGGPDYTLFARTQPFVGWAASTILTFGWDAVPGAAAYRVTLADEPTFKHPKIIFRATQTVHTFKQLRAKHLYYLQVYPIDADSHVIRPDIWLGDSHKPTVGRTGYVNDLHLTGRTSTTLAFAWAPFLFNRCCTQYQLQISSLPTFRYFRSAWSLHGNNALTFTNLKPGTTYYVRVRARNPSQTVTTPWSGTRQAATL